MKKSFGSKTYVFPMPVLVISTFNNDGSVNAMTAAWGGTYDTNQIFICLSRDHKTSQNIIDNRVFSVAFADKDHIKESDYFGIVSGNDDKDKFLKTGLHVIKGEKLNVPVIEEYPISIECEVVKIDHDATDETIYVVANIVNVLADSLVIDDKNKIDITKANLISFDPSKAGYHIIGERVGNAFVDGKKIK